MQKWEYKTIRRMREWPDVGLYAMEWDSNISELLPALGEEGWELVTVVPRSSQRGESYAGTTNEVMGL